MYASNLQWLAVWEKLADEERDFGARRRKVEEGIV